MEKYTYDTENNEKLTEVTVHKVWLNEDLMPDDSKYRGSFPEVWRGIQDEVDVEWRGFHFKVKDLNQFITSSQELFIVFLTTESFPPGYHSAFGQRMYLSNRKVFIDITKLMVLTQLFGCRYQYIPPPHDDFVNEFVGEVYF